MTGDQQVYFTWAKVCKMTPLPSEEPRVVSFRSAWFNILYF